MTKSSVKPWGFLGRIAARLNGYNHKDYTQAAFTENPVAFRQPSPWLMLPYCRRNEEDDVGRECKGEYCCRFHDVVTNEFYHIDFPEAFGKTCRGAGFGWLAFTQETPSGFLINPITRQRIDLPPVTTLPGVTYRPNLVGYEYVRYDCLDCKVAESGSWMAHSFVNKLVMSSDPTRKDCVVLGLFESCFGGVALCRPGLDAEWTTVVDSPRYYTDAVFWRNQFYAVDCGGNVDVISYNPCSTGGSAQDCLPTPTKSRFLTTHHQDWRYLGLNDHYLVENPSTGELMLVHRVKDWKDCYGPYLKPMEREELHFEDGEEDAVYVDLHDHPSDHDALYETTEFKVFELDQQTRDWQRVHSIGDYALFVGINGATFVSADDYPGCRVNCIYFTDDYREGQSPNCYGGYDIGVYDMEKRSVEAFSCGSLYDPVLIWPPPVWVFQSDDWVWLEC